MSVQSQLVSFFQKNTDAHLVLFENMYFYCTYSVKTTILSVLGTGHFLKSQKLIPSKKNQSVLIAKISSHKTQKTANPQKYPAKISFHTVSVRKMIGRLINHSLRTADAFPVVALFFGGREATTGNASAVRRLDQPGPVHYFWFFTCVSSGLLDYLRNH